MKNTASKPVQMCVPHQQHSFLKGAAQRETGHEDCDRYMRQLLITQVLCQ